MAQKRTKPTGTAPGERVLEALETIAAELVRIRQQIESRRQVVDRRNDFADWFPQYLREQLARFVKRR